MKITAIDANLRLQMSLWWAFINYVKCCVFNISDRNLFVKSFDTRGETRRAFNLFTEMVKHGHVGLFS